jgi:aspartyl-tRNA(Asn)/glutamyl-tRNA(Gln) amidotransferase subunit B
MNSFRAVERALVYEVQRQEAELEAGNRIVQETRGWNEAQGVTVSQRTKESAHDYRYFPEPDIPPLILAPEWIEARRDALPELPDARRRRFEESYSLGHQDADLLTTDRYIADYYETAVEAARPVNGSAKDVANWVVGELFRLLNDSGLPSSALAERMPPAHIASVLDLLAKGTINRPSAKQVFEQSFQKGTDPAQLVKEQGLTQISDSGELAELARQIIASNDKAVTEYRKGKTSAIQFLVGQMMKATKGKANPQTAREVLQTELDGGA